ncbi:MAG: hypothetical protein IT337_11915 [Thermomicrobiales bacterium]|nr:hypothetical protein [Thermomicrobiales bacterium]
MGQERPEASENHGASPGEAGRRVGSSDDATARARGARGALLTVTFSLAAIAVLWLVAHNAPSAGGEPPSLMVFTAAPTPTAIVASTPLALAQPTVIAGTERP